MGVRLLLADDHEIVRRGLRALLEAEPGWEIVAEAGDGRDAIEKTKEMKPDVAILDISMPSLNGLDAARQIVTSGSPTKVGRPRRTARQISCATSSALPCPDRGVIRARQ